MSMSTKFVSYLLSILAFGSMVVPALSPIANAQTDPNLLGCLNKPKIDPTKDFIANFNNKCYAVAFTTSQGGSDLAGDLNARYDRIYYHVTPGYELVIAGTFPNARYFSITAYDSHALGTAELLDNQILPLNSSFTNPFLPNTPFAANQLYGITVGFGDPIPTNPSPGCSTSDTTIDQNFMDASMIHQGISWNGYPGLPANFPVHLTGPSLGGGLFIRTYDSLSDESIPTVMIRQTSDGCAITVQQAKDKSIISLDPLFGASYADKAQVKAHEQFAYGIQTNECYQADPLNQAYWSRSSDYVPGDNDDAAYLSFDISPDIYKAIRKGDQFIRIQFQLPQMPTTPCADDNCYLTGSEQLRYRSLSFQNGVKTLASLKDSDMVRDPSGNVAIIVGIGTKPPSYVTAANYYTYLDLSAARQYKDFDQIALRDILPNASFSCSAFNVPYLTSEYNPVGGFMGNYVPTVDYPTADQISQTPVPVVRPNSCLLVPTNPPTACGPNVQ